MDVKDLIELLEQHVDLHVTVYVASAEDEYEPALAVGIRRLHPDEVISDDPNRDVNAVVITSDVNIANVILGTEERISKLERLLERLLHEWPLADINAVLDRRRRGDERDYLK